MIGNDVAHNTPSAVQQRCYTVDDLRVILNVSRSTVYQLLKRNEFRWFQIGGGKYRISNGYLLPYSGRWAKKQCAAVPRGVLRGQNGTERKNAGGLISRDFEQNAGKPGSDGAADRACKADGVEIGRKSAWIDRRYSFALDGQ